MTETGKVRHMSPEQAKRFGQLLDKDYGKIEADLGINNSGRYKKRVDELFGKVTALIGGIIK